MLLSLQYLRGIASLLVVLYHAKGEINNVYTQSNLGDLLFQNGYIGVDLFFMISGFVIMLSTEKSKSVYNFIIKRIFRIYPIYFILLLFSMYAFGFKFDSNFIKSLLFINIDIHSQAPWFGYSIVFTAWTLMYEFIFYIIFSLSMMISWNYRGVICSAFLIIIPISIQLYFTGKIGLSGYDAVSFNENKNAYTDIVRVLSSPMFIEFCIGILTYSIHKKINISNLSKFIRLFLIFAIMAFVFFYSSGYNGLHGITNCGFYGLMLLLSFSLYEKRYNMPSIPALNTLGNLSYSMYLTHPIVMGIFSKGLISSDIYNKEHGFSNVLLIVFITLVLSWILYNSIEVYFVKKAREVIKN